MGRPKGAPIDAVTGKRVKAGEVRGITPERLAEAGTEHAHQSALFCWASLKTSVVPELRWLFAVPNGGERDRIVASRMKAEGVKSGVSDIVLPVARGGWFGLFIEMKRADGGTVSDKQKEFHDFATKEGYACCVAYGWLQAKSAIEWYMSKPPTAVVDRIGLGQ